MSIIHKTLLKLKLINYYKMIIIRMIMKIENKLVKIEFLMKSWIKSSNKILERTNIILLILKFIQKHKKEVTKFKQKYVIKMNYLNQ